MILRQRFWRLIATLNGIMIFETRPWSVAYKYKIFVKVYLSTSLVPITP